MIVAPRIFGFCNSPSCVGAGDTHDAVAIAEDGVVLVNHISSSHAWGEKDLGESWDLRAEYSAHYPDGYDFEWTDNPDNHEGVQAALMRAGAGTPRIPRKLLPRDIAEVPQVEVSAEVFIDTIDRVFSLLPELGTRENAEAVVRLTLETAGKWNTEINAEFARGRKADPPELSLDFAGEVMAYGLLEAAVNTLSQLDQRRRMRDAGAAIFEAVPHKRLAG